jgi:hypothetical protein
MDTLIENETASDRLDRIKRQAVDLGVDTVGSADVAWLLFGNESEPERVCPSCKMPFREGDRHRIVKRGCDGPAYVCEIFGPAPTPADTAHVIVNWSFGYAETTENLTKDELWDLIQYGRRDEDGEVTSVTIFVSTSSDQAAIA